MSEKGCSDGVCEASDDIPENVVATGDDMDANESSDKVTSEGVEKGKVRIVSFTEEHRGTSFKVTTNQ